MLASFIRTGTARSFYILPRIDAKSPYPNATKANRTISSSLRLIERIGHGMQNVQNGAHPVDTLFSPASRQELEISSVYHYQDVSWSFSMAGIPHQREETRSLHSLATYCMEKDGRWRVLLDSVMKRSLPSRTDYHRRTRRSWTYTLRRLLDVRETVTPPLPIIS